MSEVTKPVNKAPSYLFWIMFFVSLFLICACIIWLKRGQPVPAQITYMDQINDIRGRMDINPILHNDLADKVAEHIYFNYDEFYENYFVVLEFMETLELADNGQYPYVYQFSLDSSIADQINSLSQFEQSIMVTPDALYWGHYENEELREYVLVLLLRNPQYEELERLQRDGVDLSPVSEGFEE